MFRPLYSVFMQGEIPDAKLRGTDWQYVSTAATVGTFLRDLYGEGGVVLCLFGAAGYAVLMNALYAAMRRTGSVAWFFVYINFLLPWVWLPFQNAFATLSFYLNAFYVVLICAVSAGLHWLVTGPQSRTVDAPRSLLGRPQDLSGRA